MRKTTLMNKAPWQFTLMQDPDQFSVCKEAMWESIELPHVFNLEDPTMRGKGCYRLSLSMSEEELSHPCYLQFDAVTTVCTVLINGEQIGVHRGGYSAFRFRVDQAMKVGDNEILVFADNRFDTGVNPLSGDFDIYGGIYRDVYLIETEETHFDLMYYGSLGVQVRTDAEGKIRTEAKVVGDTPVRIRYTLREKDSRTIKAQWMDQAEYQVEGAHLWNGKKDPFLYELEAALVKEDGEILDMVTLNVGFASRSISAGEGFFLNGQHLALNGVAKHQDRQGVGSACSREDLEEDMALVKEIGARSIRLSHYQHPQYFYDLCDKEGIVVWTEIPMLAMPDDNDAAMENACEQLCELILQNSHHPSIAFYGLQNEIGMLGESSQMYRKMRVLNSLAHQLDDTRLSVSANEHSVQVDSPLNTISDADAYNLYFGWYYGEIGEYTDFIDAFVKENPNVPLGFSEYGVDANPLYHSDRPEKNDYTEEFQAYFHETVYPQMVSHPGTWGTFVWNLCDFTSSARRQGEEKVGTNKKGLVTWDRKTRKDAFYYYKAQWSEEPMLYLAGKRYVHHTEEKVEIKGYTNAGEVLLYMDGRIVGNATPENGIFRFKNVSLGEVGSSHILRAEVKTDASICDERRIERCEKEDESYKNPFFVRGINVKDWFVRKDEEESMFAKDCYSILDTFGEIMKCPEAFEIMKPAYPDVTQRPGMDLFVHNSTVLALVNIMHHVSEEELKELNRKLNKVKKI